MLPGPLTPESARALQPSTTIAKNIILHSRRGLTVHYRLAGGEPRRDTAGGTSRRPRRFPGRPRRPRLHYWPARAPDRVALAAIVLITRLRSWDGSAKLKLKRFMAAR